MALHNIYALYNWYFTLPVFIVIFSFIYLFALKDEEAEFRFKLLSSIGLGIVLWLILRGLFGFLFFTFGKYNPALKIIAFYLFYGLFATCLAIFIIAILALMIILTKNTLLYKTLRNLLRPRWKYGSNSEQLAAIKNTNKNNILQKIIRSNANYTVLEAAIAKLNQEAILNGLFSTPSISIYARILLAKKVTDSNLFIKLIPNTESEELQAIAINKIGSCQALKGFLLDNCIMVKNVPLAILTINDYKTLVEIAKGCNNENIIRRIIEYMDNNDFLREIAEDLYSKNKMIYCSKLINAFDDIQKLRRLETNNDLLVPTRLCKLGCIDGFNKLADKLLQNPKYYCKEIMPILIEFMESYHNNLSESLLLKLITIKDIEEETERVEAGSTWNHGKIYSTEIIQGAFSFSRLRSLAKKRLELQKSTM
jgi:hypothetical protein